MFTKPELKSFRSDFSEAVKNLENKYAVKISLGTISFDSYQFHSKLEVKKTVIPIADGKTISPEQFEFEKYCGLVGLKKEDFGKSYISKGIKLTLSGINLKASKNIILLTGSNGNGYCLSVEQWQKAIMFENMKNKKSS
jgi:hypothetical protein